MTGAPLELPRFDGQALCAEVDPELMFPEPNDSLNQAKWLCRRCELREPCLAWALQHNEMHGIWGGMSPAERQATRRRRGVA